ncbi:uncharacterized protein GLRG_03020 [Colletotrichum graminicola M1.001]|uniref:Uncharacterized protein n=1 Tax=Colletotrichum graminicola (strain M1.001 / M2 / FGSC 10212) TaxID=645133 RepID=E3QAI8_COLGM|nr:uncharacterized protein GLRG_03020 [Colletotrichum graminicola M1.001]EFQ27876.1 hypothetical protein GLRG_03020 [Colletotrichum graminicola M1.001]
MNDHGRKLSWTAQLSPYLRGLKMKNIMPSPKPSKSPKSPKPPRNFREDDSGFRITHTPDRPERPISRTAIPTDEQCMEFLMSLQRQEEHRRGSTKSGLKMWPNSQEDDPEDRRYLRSVRVESVQFEEARLARTNSFGPARVVDVGRSSTKSTLATPGVSDKGEEEEGDEDDDDDDNESIVEPKRCTDAALSPPPTLYRNKPYLEVHTPRANTSRWSDDSLESRLSSREHDSPCVQRCQRVTLRSSTEASSSPTVFGDDSMEPSTPSPLTPVKIRPATPFTDSQLRAETDPITPPPSDQVAHLMHISPEPVPREYSWRSSRDTVLNAEAPASKASAWLPEPWPREEVKNQKQGSEPEVYGDWADYYFEDGNFWDGYSEEDDTRVEGESDADDERNEHGTDEEDQKEEKEEDQKGRRQADGEVYPRYESFIEDYKKNIMSITVTEA